MTLSAHCSSSLRPTAVEPVNESLRARPSRIIGSITGAGSEVVTTLSTPSGSPASCMMPASARMESGVCSAGLTTIVQPAATAGPIFRVPMANGKFQGVISRHGPTGSRISNRRPWPFGATEKPPSIRTASSENQRKNSAA